VSRLGVEVRPNEVISDVWILFGVFFFSLLLVVCLVAVRFFVWRFLVATCLTLLPQDPCHTRFSALLACAHTARQATLASFAYRLPFASPHSPLPAPSSFRCASVKVATNGRKASCQFSKWLCERLFVAKSPPSLPPSLPVVSGVQPSLQGGGCLYIPTRQGSLIELCALATLFRASLCSLSLSLSLSLSTSLLQCTSGDPLLPCVCVCVCVL
jgi:hypothetical protein